MVGMAQHFQINYLIKDIKENILELKRTRIYTVNAVQGNYPCNNIIWSLKTTDCSLKWRLQIS